MNQLVDLSDMHYAVIEALHTETGPECFVMAYPNEQSLRNVIAAPSIVAFGFSSREEAVARSRACVPTAGYQGIAEATAGGRTGRHHQGLAWAERRSETGSALRRLGRFLVTSYHDVVTSAFVIFSSRNTVSAAIRMALGSSV